MKRRYFTSTRVAGFQYHEGLFCIEDLKLGSELTFQREVNNRHDPNAVAVYYQEYKLGYLPTSDNEQISIFLDMGWSELFEVRVNKIDQTTHPERKIGITIFVRQNKSQTEQS